MASGEPSPGRIPALSGTTVSLTQKFHQSDEPVNTDNSSTPPSGLAPPFDPPPPNPEVARLQRQLDRLLAEQYFLWKRRQRRTSFLLFVLTFLSTFVVGAKFVPLSFLAAEFVPAFDRFLQAFFSGPAQMEEAFWTYTRQGLEYAIPLMSILLCHEMGHYLQSVWNRVPASLPYFIPMPLPPLGTMGAVIFQSRGVATRRQMFDIAVSGPIAGLVITIPVLCYGIWDSEFTRVDHSSQFVFGKPLLIHWLEKAIHGPAPAGQFLAPNSFAFAGWVGVFITAMNLLPVGQLDGGHILYTLIGRSAHVVAYLVIAAGIGVMVVREQPSYLVLLFLLMLSGPRHPPTANDREPLGLVRHVIGWLTLSFLVVGFTPTPISDREEARDAGQRPQMVQR